MLTRLTRRPSLVSALICCLVLGALPACFAPRAGAVVVDTTKNKNNNNNTNKNEKPKAPVILKFLGSQTQRYGGKEMLVVYGINLANNRQVEMAVPPEDSKARQYEPKNSVKEALDQINAGDFVKVETDTNSYGTWLNGIDKYKMKPGEEVPGNFVFYETYLDKQSTLPLQVVTVMKFGQAYDLVLPRKSDGKQMQIDPALLEAVNKFSKNDVVAITAYGDPPVIRTIALYKAPESATLGKLAPLADIATDLKGPAVELQQEGGKTLTLPLLGQKVGKRWTPDPALLARVKSMKPGAAVLYSTVDQDGVTYLKDLKAAPAQKTAPATASKRFNTGK